jgi:hypothetical protein
MLTFTNLQDDLCFVNLVGGDNPGPALLCPLFFMFQTMLGFRESPRKACRYRGHDCWLASVTSCWSWR